MTIMAMIVSDCGSTDVHGQPVLHIYSAIALIDSHCTYITRVDLDEIDRKRPTLKVTMTRFALKRAVRFGVDAESAAQNHDLAKRHNTSMKDTEVQHELGEIVASVEAVKHRLVISALATEADPDFEVLAPASAKAMVTDRGVVEGELDAIVKQLAEFEERLLANSVMFA